MKTYALVGKSGTGKSFRSLELAGDNNIEAVIDDGLLISQSRILAGRSAKHEKTRMGSVKCAIFEDNSHADTVKNAIAKNNVESVLVIGTSEKMVQQIAQRLGLPDFEKIFHIEDIATPEEISIADKMRSTQGKHIIPVPALELKKQFSGYFLRSLFTPGKRENEKTIMRPTYSYLGEFKIAPKVICDICTFEATHISGISRVFKVKNIPDANGCVDINIDIECFSSVTISELCPIVQRTLVTAIEKFTSINVNHVNIFVKSINFNSCEEL